MQIAHAKYSICLPGHQIDLTSYFRGGLGIIQRGPIPMGLVPGAIDVGQIARKYESPVIDPNEFPFLKPFFRTRHAPKDQNALGFCYEYGLGVQKNQQKALHCYESAVLRDPHYSSFFNLGRLHFVSRRFPEANRALNEAENHLNDLKREGNRLLELWAQQRANPPAHVDPNSRDYSRDNCVKADLKICNKALTKVLQTQLELYR